MTEGNPNMVVYHKEDIPERLHYKNNERVPSIVVVADPGYAVYAVSSKIQGWIKAKGV